MPEQFSDLDLGRTIRDFVAGQKLFNRYALVRILGRGGMGIVWLARDEELEHEVALKFLPEFVALDDQSVADLKRETRRSLELHHHHIVRIHHFETDQRVAGISMEYVDGATLSSIKVKSENGCLSVEQIQPWIEQLCEALAYAHTRARIVHRDLKPANVMVNGRSEIKVTDFGIARSIADSVSRVSVVQQTGGTLAYMSPQQLLGAEAMVSDDIYSLGATIYDLLAGKPPFYTGDIARQIENVVPPAMAELRSKLGLNGPAIPAKWEATVAACLAKEATQRPQSAQEVAYRLGLVEHFMPSPTHKTGRPEVLRMPLKTGLGKKKGALVAAMSALLVAGALAGWWFGIEQPRREAERQRQLTEQKDKDQRDNAATQQEIAEQERLAGERKAKAEADAVKERLATQQRAKAEEAKKKEDSLKAVAGASKEQPYVNSLGMKFVPVAGTGVLFSIWETRVKDYKSFVETTKREWPKPDFKKTEEHPAVNVSWEDATTFCEWLTESEQKAGMITPSQSYRLPLDLEWSAAVGMENESASTPEKRHMKVKRIYPKWSHPKGTENYDPSLKLDDMDGLLGHDSTETSPVGSFEANRYGLYDMGKNVWEWCQDWWNAEKKYRVLRGAWWFNEYPESLLSSYRRGGAPGHRDDSDGFRCVLVVERSR